MRHIDTATATSIPYAVAKRFIETWHYSNRMPTGKNICYGWYTEAVSQSFDDMFLGGLYAVTVYGIGVNPYQAAFLGVENSELIELKRMARVEPKIDDLPLTAFMARCHKQLKSAGYRYIVTFSDPEHGHNGTIYKAANFHHMGKTNTEWHLIDEDGVVRHRRYAFRFARRKDISVSQARDLLGLQRHETVPKDRWLLKIP